MTNRPNAETDSPEHRPAPGRDPDDVDDVDDPDVGPGVSTGDEVLYQTHPTVRPVLLLMALTLVGAVVVAAVLATNPDVVGGDDLATLLLGVVGTVTVLVLLKQLIKVFVIRRTTYTITASGLRREYELFYRQRVREIPVHQLRGHEYVQSRVQTLLGYGTIRMLTGGTNRSLGFVEFEHIDDPAGVREALQTVAGE
ncbi:PH domain-containing protein [Halorientalis halophila]|uniref:PH domain-containing protein n=1 Tax=Halorientalis halophila TaxID=3108499 RepID=UPI00300B06CF